MSENIVIVGGGIMGCCTAYYLSKYNNVNITIIEKEYIACAASGKAGGFLAPNWVAGNLGRLAQESYNIYEQIGKKYKDKFLYRNIDSYEIKLSQKNGKNEKPFEWISKKIISKQQTNSYKNTAQIHPLKFCNFMQDQCGNKLRVITGEVVSIKKDKRNSSKIIGVEYISKSNGYSVRKRFVPCTKVILCMGPWSFNAFKWFENCKQLKYCYGLKNTSIVVNNNKMKPKNTPKMAIFLVDDNDVPTNKLINKKENKGREYQIYPRHNGTMYLMTKAIEKDIPNNNNDIKFDEINGKKLLNIKNKLSNLTKNGEIVIGNKTSCYYPMSHDGVPLIGKLPNIDNVYIACGHGCWGILLAPITGKIISEMIIYGNVKCVDECIIKEYDPARKISKKWEKEYEYGKKVGDKRDMVNISDVDDMLPVKKKRKL